MRSLVPCLQCGTRCCSSGFVFKNVQSKCICKVCKHSETVTSEETTTEKRPLVLNLDGNFILFYKIFLINLVMQFLH